MCTCKPVAMQATIWMTWNANRARECRFLVPFFPSLHGAILADPPIVTVTPTCLKVTYTMARTDLTRRSRTGIVEALSGYGLVTTSQLTTTLAEFEVAHTKPTAMCRAWSHGAVLADMEIIT